MHRRISASVAASGRRHVTRAPRWEARAGATGSLPAVNPAVGVPEALAKIEADLVAPGGFFEVGEDVVLGEPMPVFQQRLPNLREAVVASVGFADKEYLIFTDGDVRRVRRHRAALHRIHARPVLCGDVDPEVESGERSLRAEMEARIVEGTTDRVHAFERLHRPAVGRGRPARRECTRDNGKHCLTAPAHAR
jgi:hypothetical protein